MNNRTLTLLLVILGLLIAALLTHSGDLTWMALPFLAYLGLGVLQSVSPGKIRLRAARTVETTRVDGVTSVQVSIDVSNEGEALPCLCIFDPLLPGMRLSDGQLEQRAGLRPEEDLRLRYTFRTRRGNFSWKTLQVVASDPFGLVETRLEIPAEGEAQVQPVLNKLRPFPLRSHRTLHSAGSIPARRGGSGTDFWGVREYQPGDPLRRLDWRLTARHPHKFFTKEFEQEEIADIGLILDARLKTDLHVGEDSLFEHSARAAGALAEVFLRQGNRVSLLIYGKPVVSLFPGYGKVQLNRILRALARATPAADSGLESLQYLPVRMFSSHSLILVITPLTPVDRQFFTRLRAYGYQVVVISPDPVDFVQPALPADRVTGLASRLARLERRLEISKITRLWIPVIDWQVDQPLAPLVRRAITHALVQRDY